MSVLYSRGKVDVPVRIRVAQQQVETQIPDFLNGMHCTLEAPYLYGLGQFTTASLGDIEKVEFNPKSILKAALLSNANSILLIHNHPTGDSKPSKDDIKATQLVEMACKIVGIKMFNHIVIGHDSYYSIVGNEEFKYRKDL